MSAAAPRGTALVTGASTGIGRACASELESIGFNVVAGVRSDADFERLSAEGRGTLQPIRLDIADADQIAACAAELRDGNPDGLAGVVNNAGVGIGGPLEAIPIEDFRRVIEVNLTGQVAVTQALLPQLRRARGRVVFMSSDAGWVAPPFLSPYAASKHALEAIGDALRLELAPFGIEVVLVEPGVIKTPIWDKGRKVADALRAGASPELLSLYGDSIDRVETKAIELAEQGAPPEDVARVVARALTARRPRPRYQVGRDAKIAVLVRRLLPDRLRDRLVTRSVGLD